MIISAQLPSIRKRPTADAHNMITAPDSVAALSTRGEGKAAANYALEAFAGTETWPRIRLRNDGYLEFGSGTANTDISLGRGTGGAVTLFTPASPAAAQRFDIHTGLEGFPRVRISGEGSAPGGRVELGSGAAAPTVYFERGNDSGSIGLITPSLKVQQDKAGTGPYPFQAFKVVTNYNRTDIADGSVGTAGIWNETNVGSANDVDGGCHGLHNQVVVTTYSGPNSEHTPQFSLLQYNNLGAAGANAGKAWLSDWNMHSAVTSGGTSSQHGSWYGHSVFSNYYHSTLAEDGPSYSFGAFTGQGKGGGASAAHLAHQTYPLGAAFLVLGRSGTTDEVTITAGWTNGLQIGNEDTVADGTWMIGEKSRVTRGILVSDFDTEGIKISTPYAGSTPRAINVVAAAGLSQFDGGISTKIKAGTFSDSDFIGTDVDGEIGVNTTTHRIEFRSGAAWRVVPKSGDIVDADIGSGAAIAKTKLAALDVVNADVNGSAAIAESKLNLATDAVAGTGSRRTLGTGAQQAAPGNDARFTKTFRTSHTFAIKGEITAADTVPSFYVPEASGQASSIISVSHKIRSGTSVTWTLLRNGSAAHATYTGGVADSTGPNTLTQTVALTDGDEIELDITAVSATPTDLTVTVIVEHVI